MFRAALFITAKKWKQPKCPSTDELINKLYIHIMKYYSLIKRNEGLMHATTWMILESIILRERSQTQKAIYYMIPFT